MEYIEYFGYISLPIYVHINDQEFESSLSRKWLAFSRIYFTLSDIFTDFRLKKSNIVIQKLLKRECMHTHTHTHTHTKHTVG